MGYTPVVGDFVNFYDHNPSTSDQCIYITLLGKRCRWFCRDNNLAVTHHRRITTTNHEDVLLDDIVEYIRCSCCREGNAKHRDKILNMGLLLPLADRWFDEIQARGRRVKAELEAKKAATPRNTAAFLSPDTPASTASFSSTFSTPGRPYTVETPSTSPSYYHYNGRSSIASSTTSNINSSPTPVSRFARSTLDLPQENRPRYDLRSRQSLNERYSPKYLSEFQPHIEDITTQDSVLWQIREPLYNRDFEAGSVYIFNRDSSPGHVKIGWTAYSVDRRLEDWSRCGYRPNKLFSVTNVPNAQRAETLTHYELIKEWRRERKCKAAHCGISHQEWFEVSKERAIQVLGDWAEFFKKARPYNTSGVFKADWEAVIKSMDSKGQMITSKALKEYYELSVKQEPQRDTNSKPIVASATSEVKRGAVPPEALEKVTRTGFASCFDRLLSAKGEKYEVPKTAFQVQVDFHSSQTTPAKVSSSIEPRPNIFEKLANIPATPLANCNDLSPRITPFKIPGPSVFEKLGNMTTVQHNDEKKSTQAKPTEIALPNSFHKLGNSTTVQAHQTKSIRHTRPDEAYSSSIFAKLGKVSTVQNEENTTCPNVFEKLRTATQDVKNNDKLSLSTPPITTHENIFEKLSKSSVVPIEEMNALSLKSTSKNASIGIFDKLARDPHVKIKEDNASLHAAQVEISNPNIFTKLGQNQGAQIPGSSISPHAAPPKVPNIFERLGSIKPDVRNISGNPENSTTASRGSPVPESDKCATATKPEITANSHAAMQPTGETNNHSQSDSTSVEGKISEIRQLIMNIRHKMSSHRNSASVDSKISEIHHRLIKLHQGMSLPRNTTRLDDNEPEPESAALPKKASDPLAALPTDHVFNFAFQPISKPGLVTSDKATKEKKSLFGIDHDRVPKALPQFTTNFSNADSSVLKMRTFAKVRSPWPKIDTTAPHPPPLYQFSFGGAPPEPHDLLPKKPYDFSAADKTPIFEEPKPVWPTDILVTNGASESQNVSLIEELAPEKIPLPPSPSLETMKDNATSRSPVHEAVDISDVLVNLSISEGGKRDDRDTLAAKSIDAEGTEKDQVSETLQKGNGSVDVKTSTLHAKSLEEAVIIEVNEKTVLSDTQAVLNGLAALEIVEKSISASCDTQSNILGKASAGVEVTTKEVPADFDAICLS